MLIFKRVFVGVLAIQRLYKCSRLTSPIQFNLCILYKKMLLKGDIGIKHLRLNKLAVYPIDFKQATPPSSFHFISSGVLVFSCKLHTGDIMVL